MTAAASHATTTTNPTAITLQPASPAGGIPGDANDPADFYGFGAALIGIALAVFVIRWFFRRGGEAPAVAGRAESSRSTATTRRVESPPAGGERPATGSSDDR